MGMTVIRDDRGALLRIEIPCTVCGRVEKDDDIIAGGGLFNMGWTKRFNDAECRSDYFCPEHKPQEENSGN